MSLDGRRAVITGAGGAIGRASALLFAREGARVAVLDVNSDAAAETVALIEERGGRAWAVAADVTDEESVAEAMTRAARLLGGIDTLFNNAGIMPHQDRSVLDLDLLGWRDILDTNLLGTALCVKYAAPEMISAGSGAIVNMSSFLSVLGCSAPQDAYAASKGAITSLTRSLAVQLGPRGIRANALAPGPIATEHVQKFFPDEVSRQRRLDRIPLGRFGTPEDAAGLACFLASDAASWLTGQVIVLDGGISTNYL